MYVIVLLYPDKAEEKYPFGLSIIKSGTSVEVSPPTYLNTKEDTVFGTFNVSTALVDISSLLPDLPPVIVQVPILAVKTTELITVLYLGTQYFSFIYVSLLISKSYFVYNLLQFVQLVSQRLGP